LEIQDLDSIQQQTVSSRYSTVRSTTVATSNGSGVTQIAPQRGNSDLKSNESERRGSQLRDEEWLEKAEQYLQRMRSNDPDKSKITASQPSTPISTATPLSTSTPIPTSTPIQTFELKRSTQNAGSISQVTRLNFSIASSVQHGVQPKLQQSDPVQYPKQFTSSSEFEFSKRDSVDAKVVRTREDLEEKLNKVSSALLHIFMNDPLLVFSHCFKFRAKKTVLRGLSCSQLLIQQQIIL
jgi:hypothetical protein